MLKVNKEFSKNAFSYATHNTIQQMVAYELIFELETVDKNILDLGCGSGMIASMLKDNYSMFYGVDFSKEMLSLHPKADNIRLICDSFDDESLFAILKKLDFDLIISSSAMQWSSDLKKLLQNIKELKRPFYGAIFTAGTFKTLHKYANIEPLLLSVDEIKKIVDELSLHVELYVKKYQLKFDTTAAMLKYIKKSGVNGSQKRLTIKQTRELIKSYPLNYLEFEVLFMRF